jgi:DNA helicase-2/ATP-dependent DNA helicase PcrA
MGTLPSRFLEEIPTELIEVEGYGLGDLSAPKENVEARHTYDEDDEFAPRVCVGSVVRHPTFGIGRVMELSGYADDLKLTITFEGRTPKKILAKYAQLEILK